MEPDAHCELIIATLIQVNTQMMDVILQALAAVVLAVAEVQEEAVAEEAVGKVTSATWTGNAENGLLA